ncbi:response regulator transcription factor [Rubrivivax albus]|uniref:Response regulator transcription factor n=1 Tax=Rubrivivax albus TaxID=2499835 RepID=A0A3S2UAT7_9BURK|nr:winged helix-turn-helix domain-containing protein [Rubrivivax albus]RVT53760.1 response regulator transcription factor [Rubrivivax albus]
MTFPAHPPASVDAVPPGVRRLLLFVGPVLPGEADVAGAMARAGWRCLWLPDMAAAQRAAAHARFDAVVLRAECEGGPAPRDIDALRQTLGCPVLVAAGAADEVDEVIALELGADAWLAGPLTARRLRAHLVAVLRQRDAARGQPEPAPLALGGWTLDEAARRLQRADRHVELTALQVALLRCLGAQPGHVVTRDALAQAAGGGRDLQARSVDVYVARLRRRLREARVDGLDIEGVRGRGYTLEIGVTPAASGLRWPWVPRTERPALGAVVTA